MRVGDLIRVGPRFWVVEADVMGEVGRESVVKLRAVGLDPPYGDDGAVAAIYVPGFILRAAFRGGAQHYQPAEVTEIAVADAALFSSMLSGAGAPRGAGGGTP